MNEIPDDICGNLFAKSYVNYGFDKPAKRNVFYSSGEDSSCGKCPSRQGSESSKLTHENNIATVTERNNNSLNCPRQFTIDDLQSTKYHGSSNSIHAPDSRNSAESRNKLRQAQNNSISDQTTSEVVNNYEPSG